ncbi:MAG: UDP-N-acetylmuramoyl-tripeptide--D-alanyl-D-alanine ligase [Paludibacteraceae bacterium]|nr:UDP-N-acetylmuramoyl-tripeptide--D-alanyl-D-alanine ligase [Paludibacteraceae bacterium]
MDWNFLIRNKSALFVTTDSRKVTPGCVFVALKGEHFDGNDFVDQARRDGAEYVICGENALTELQDLARAWRRSLSIPIIGITGTNGKTTTKELCAAVLSTRYNLYYTQGNLNNQIGVPLSLLNITRAHEMAIIEMGASHPGDIKELVEIAEPTCGLITNVGKAHLQGFGSFEGVMRTKAELYDFLLAHNGTVFRNADNPYLANMYLSACKASGLSVERSVSETVNCQLSTVNYHTGSMPEGTHLVGGYNAENISAAIAVGGYFGVSEEDALAAIRAYVPTNNRSQLMQTERNTLVVDAYNANPTSMTAAINAFTSSPTAQRSYSAAVLQRSGLTDEVGHETPRCFILGAMRELGEYSHLEHQNIVNMLLERKADIVLLVGEEYKATTAPYPIFENVEALAAYLKTTPLTGYHILLKGSRANQLEKVIPLL